MKILLGVPEYPPYHIGGGGEVFKNLAENYKKLGHDVVVIYGYYPTKTWWEDIKEYNDEHGIKFYQIPEIPYPKSQPFLRTVMPPNPKTWLQLNQIIKKEKPDVAHLHGFGFMIINIISHALKKQKIPYIYTLHGAPVSQDRLGGIIKIAYFFYKIFFGSYTLRHAKNITAVSKFTTTFSEFKRYDGRIVVIHNGIDLDQYHPTDEPSIYKPFITGEKEKPIVCLSLGRIELLKGFHLFIKIIPELLKLNLNIKYFIAGRDNGYKKILEQLIERENLHHHVFFLGQLEFREKINAIQNCDFIVVPSLIENFPVVPLEAMAMGKVVIANKIGGVDELINCNNGVLVRMDDRAITTRIISEIMNKESLREILAINAFETVKKLGWDQITKKYSLLWSQ